MGLLYLPSDHPLSIIYHVNIKYAFIALGLASLGLSSCDDPIARKEFEIASKDHSRRGVIVTTKEFTFTDWSSRGKYSLPKADSISEDAGHYWVSASNDGFFVIPSFLRPGNEPPVIPYLDEDKKPIAVHIRSIKGARFFGLGTNLIAGAFFSGQVATSSLASKPLASTLFGQPYATGIPQELEFVYQYKAGAKVIHGEGKNVELPAQDKGSVSAVFYEVTDDAAFLNGTNLQTDSRIIAKGYVELEPTEGSDWVTYKLPLEVVNQERDKAIDLTTKKYRLALVFSSSYRGAEYIGAVGSELLLKKVTIKDRPRLKN